MIYQIFTARTTTGASRAFVMTDGGSATPVRTFHCNGTTSSGSGAASVDIEVSNNATDWKWLGTISLTLGTTSTSDAFPAEGAWQFVRGKVTAISGTGASINLIMGA